MDIRHLFEESLELCSSALDLIVDYICPIMDFEAEHFFWKREMLEFLDSFLAISILTEDAESHVWLLSAHP